jgi:hypothetical protein
VARISATGENQNESMGRDRPGVFLGRKWEILLFTNMVSGSGFCRLLALKNAHFYFLLQMGHFETID